jgi:uncharacterized membrane protein
VAEIAARPAFILGLGLGGFVDGIVLHQILQWHHMLTGDAGGEPMDTVAGLQTNTLVDGFFHLATWILVAVATSLMLRAWQRGRLAPPWRAHAGLLDHQLLGLHHVRDDLGAPLGWDIAFLASGLLLIAVGAALVRTSALDVERAQ